VFVLFMLAYNLGMNRQPLTRCGKEFIPIINKRLRIHAVSLPDVTLPVKADF
jgi:hypothetical protein